MNNKIIPSTLLVSVLIAMVVGSEAFISNYNQGNIDLPDVSSVLEVSDKISVFDGWVGIGRLDMMKEPSESSDVVGFLNFNEKIEYRVYDDDWFIVQYENGDAYVKSEYVLDEDTGYASYTQYVLDNNIGYNLYQVPKSSGFKSFMDYRTITCNSSAQYQLQTSNAVTGLYGIRMVNDRYCVAIGSYFTSRIGQYFDLILENGTVIPCILADQKADEHTDENNIITVSSGCMSEFIVDSDLLSDSVKKHGDISYCKDEWDSPVSEVKIYNKNIFDNN